MPLKVQANGVQFEGKVPLIPPRPQPQVIPATEHPKAPTSKVILVRAKAASVKVKLAGHYKQKFVPLAHIKGGTSSTDQFNDAIDNCNAEGARLDSVKSASQLLLPQ